MGLEPRVAITNNPKKEEERESPRSFPQANLYIAAALLDKQRHVHKTTKKSLALISGSHREATLESTHLTLSAI